jgi:hypothetical protein
MEHGPKRLVKVREQYEGELHEVVKTLDPTGFGQIAGTARGRSASPKKRKASDTLPPIVEAKRRCETSCITSHHEPNATDESSDQADEQRTPSLYSDDGTAVVQNPPPTEAVADYTFEAERLSSLRMREIRKRRPDDSTLLCCDYNLAERANALGIAGKPEFGGGHLCNNCLGSESAPDWDELDEPEKLIWEVR